MTAESGAHATYKARLVEAGDTLVTRAVRSGLAGPAPRCAERRHRSLAGPGSARPRLAARPLQGHRTRPLPGADANAIPLGGNAGPAPTDVRSCRGDRQGAPEPDRGRALYAGACVNRIVDIRPAGELVRELAS